MVFEIDKKPSNSVAIIDDCDKKMSYGELTSLAKEMKNVLLERELVFCLCKNVCASLAGFIALYDNHDVCLLLSSSIDKSLLQTLDDIYQPSYYWRAKEPLSSDDDEVCFSYDGYSLYKTRHTSTALHPNLSMLMTTSGTTGSPKLVRYKYGNIEHNAKNVARVFGWTADERGIIDLPMQYTMGLNVICSHLYAGASVLLTSYSLMNPLFWKFVKTYQGTNFTGVPFSYEILKKLKFLAMDLPFLKTMAEGGGKLSDDLFTSFAQFAENSGKRFFATFGTTETSARLAYLNPKEATTHCGSIGKAIPEGKLYIVDDSGNTIIESDKEGELVYEGPNVTMGYATESKDLSKGEEFDGIYHTGDLAKMDIEGNFYIVGRKKRFLKLYGLRVSLDQVERMVSDEFHIACACTGDDNIMDIYIEEESFTEKVLSFVSEKTGLMKKSFSVHAITSIPRFESGKINYKQLNESKK